MKTNIVILFAVICIIALPVVIAADSKADFEVPLAESAFSRCQNGIREPSESCDLGTKTIPPGEDLCPALGKVLGIVQVCRSESCVCIPDRMDCGNGIREGAEWCDPGSEQKEDPEKNDLCPGIVDVLQRPMVCNPDTCLCKATTDITANVTCGDGEIGFNEQCEIDSDCDEDKECSSTCKCVVKIPEMNQSVLDSLLNQSDIPTPEEKEQEEVKMTEKKEFDYHDLVGETVPDLFYSDFKTAYANINVSAEDSSYLIGVNTKHNVIQEIVDGGFEEPDMIVFVSEADAKEIIASDDRMDALDTFLGEGKIEYHPVGLFGRMWFWFKGIFR